jgi:perosamine synthetase
MKSLSTERSCEASGPSPSDSNSSGRSLGKRELDYLKRVIGSGTLTTTSGHFGRAFEREAEEKLKLERVIACSSGSAALHAAIAALNTEPGSEFIVTPLTDFGGVAPILWQGSIPVFCDIDPNSGQMTAKTVADRLSERTRGIIVTHMFGAPADVPAIIELARQHGLSVIEDCAQAYLTTINDQLVGTFGELACYSMQQTKQICAGEGGLVGTSNSALGKRAHAFVNKARDYSDQSPDHHFLAMNFRITELSAAVALAQIEQLPFFIEQRRRMATKLDAALLDIGGFVRPQDILGAHHSFWRYPIVLQSGAEHGGVNVVAAILARYGIDCAPHYKRPAYEWTMFRSRATFGTSTYPFSLARREALDYSAASYPGVRQFLQSVIVLPWNERVDTYEVDRIAGAFAAARRRLS